MEITKAKVLEVFMAHYNKIQEEDQWRRALMASNSAQDEFILWRPDLSEEERASLDKVCAYLNEILEQDFGIKVLPGEKITPVEKKGSAAGGMAAIEWLKTNAHLVPPLEKMEEDPPAWGKKVGRWAVEVLPAERPADEEWTRGFVMGFSGDLLRHIRGQEPMGAGWDRPDPC